VELPEPDKSKPPKKPRKRQEQPPGEAETEAPPPDKRKPAEEASVVIIIVRGVFYLGITALLASGGYLVLLPAQVFYAGAITDKQGSPVQGATVALLSNGKVIQETHTNTAGDYAFSGLNRNPSDDIEIRLSYNDRPESHNLPANAAPRQNFSIDIHPFHPLGNFEIQSAGVVCQGSAAQVQLTWSTSQGAGRYQVLRDGDRIGETQEKTEFLDRQPTPGQHIYLVTAVSTEPQTTLNSSNSRAVNVTPCADLGPGPFVLANPTPACRATQQPSISLTWSRSARAETYVVLRGTEGGPPAVVVAPRLREMHYSDTAGLEFDRTYYYSVLARNSHGEQASQPNEVKVRPGRDLCPPEGFQITTATPTREGPVSVYLVWNPSLGATWYEVYRDSIRVSGQIPGTATDFTDQSPALRRGQRYRYFVRAHNGNLSTDSHSLPVDIPILIRGSRLAGTCIMSRPATR
jgi:hypothetical protein